MKKTRKSKCKDCGTIEDTTGIMIDYKKPYQCDLCHAKYWDIITNVIKVKV